MPKALCYAGMAIAAVILVFFLLDLAVGIPFMGRYKIMDVMFVLCAIGLGYLSWGTLREQD